MQLTTYIKELYNKQFKTSQVQKLADDSIIYAKNQQDHDKTLHVLLSRFHQKNLTLNRNKCEFNKSELKFMGIHNRKIG